VFVKQSPEGFSCSEYLAIVAQAGDCCNNACLLYSMTLNWGPKKFATNSENCDRVAAAFTGDEVGVSVAGVVKNRKGKFPQSNAFIDMSVLRRTLGAV
jgi:hypothetical protein